MTNIDYSNPFEDIYNNNSNSWSCFDILRTHNNYSDKGIEGCSDSVSDPAESIEKHLSENLGEDNPLKRLHSIAGSLKIRKRDLHQEATEIEIASYKIRRIAQNPVSNFLHGIFHN